MHELTEENDRLFVEYPFFLPSDFVDPVAIRTSLIKFTEEVAEEYHLWWAVVAGYLRREEGEHRFPQEEVVLRQQGEVVVLRQQGEEVVLRQ